MLRLSRCIHQLGSKAYLFSEMKTSLIEFSRTPITSAPSRWRYLVIMDGSKKEQGRSATSPCSSLTYRACNLTPQKTIQLTLSCKPFTSSSWERLKRCLNMCNQVGDRSTQKVKDSTVASIFSGVLRLIFQCELA